ncbi:MAG: type II secretion system protein [Verrucomicrobiota bacterium]
MTTIQKREGFTLIELLTVITIIAILAGLSVPVYNSVREKASLAETSNNARQIVMALKVYASDEGNGSFVKAKYNFDGEAEGPIASANEAYRTLINLGYLDTESIFASANSLARPDDNISSSADVLADVNPEGAPENHWGYTKGLTDSSPSRFPLVWENSVGDPGDNPEWDPAKAGTEEPGRTWSGGKIMIGFADGSAKTKRTAKRDEQSPLRNENGPQTIFEEMTANSRTVSLFNPEGLDL